MKKKIRFRRLSNSPTVAGGMPIERWEIASSVKELNEKLDGEMAEVIMPARPWWVRLYRILFPLRAIEMQ